MDVGIYPDLGTGQSPEVITASGFRYVLEAAADRAG
jgi:hypothetical protein